MRRISEKTALKILDLPLREDNDAGVKTIREYFKALLSNILLEQEGFSGKRPFGNSGWIIELYWALVNGRVIKGIIDEDGDVGNYDSSVADRKLQQALQYMCASDEARRDEFATKYSLRDDGGYG